MTVARIAAHPEGEGPLRFVVNARNSPSIELHKELGFTLESTKFHMPGVEFEGGAGLLFRLD